MVQAGKGSISPLRQDETMSLLNDTAHFSPSPIAIRRALRAAVRRISRAVNTAIAAIIAQREHQASLTLLRRMSDRDLRDIGISRSETGEGLAGAARARRRAQRLREEPCP
jgi:uncharacterized protein YjiS (DUF1127 family)